MNFALALLAWFAIAAFLVTGLVFAVKGSLLMFIIGLILFIGAFGWWGCAVH